MRYSDNGLRSRAARWALRWGLLRDGIIYISDCQGWVIDQEGNNLLHQAEVVFLGRPMAMMQRCEGARSDLLHFGSMWNYLNSGTKAHPSNRVIATIYHGSDKSDEPAMREGIEKLQKNLGRSDLVTTACTIMERRLLEWGVSREKLRRIALGVDLKTFGVKSAAEREALRDKFNVPNGALCVGLFQKDGVGWGEGDEPKKIKGPDIFVEVVRRLAEKFPIFVLLTGPARGYVKKNLARHGVPFAHHLEEDPTRMPDYYNCLDLYLLTSREEGGPKSLPESMATGVPLVSTRVGMAPDMIENGVNGFLTDVDDVDGLTECATRLLERPALRQSFAERALQTVRSYDSTDLARRYCSEIYAPLLTTLSSHR